MLHRDLWAAIDFNMRVAFTFVPLGVNCTFVATARPYSFIWATKTIRYHTAENSPIKLGFMAIAESLFLVSKDIFLRRNKRKYFSVQDLNNRITMDTG